MTVTLTDRERELLFALLDRTGFDSSMQLLRYLLWAECDDWGLAPGAGDFERGRWGQLPGGGHVPVPAKTKTRRPRLGGKPPKPGTRHPWRQYQQPIEGSDMTTHKKAEKKDEKKKPTTATPTNTVNDAAKTARPHCDHHKEYHPTCRACRDLQDPNQDLPAKVNVAGPDNGGDPELGDPSGMSDAQLEAGLEALIEGVEGGPAGDGGDPGDADPSAFAGGESGGAGAGADFDPNPAGQTDQSFQHADSDGGDPGEAEGDDHDGGDDDGLGDEGTDPDDNDADDDEESADSASDTGSADGGS